MDNPPFALYSSLRPPAAYVWAAGELDLLAAPSLSELLRDTVASGCRVVRVDLAGVTFIDASCVDLFLLLRRRLDTPGASLRFLAASSCVRRAFALACLPGVLGPTQVVAEPRRGSLRLGRDERSS